MKIKLYTGVGVFAAIALVMAMSHAGAQQTLDQQPSNPENQAVDRNNLDQPVTGQQRTTEHQRTDGQLYGRDNVTQRDHAAHGKAFKASDLIGMNVRGRTGDDNIGSINDLMIGQDGRVRYAAVSFGGFLGIGSKMFAVPFEAIEFVVNDDDSFARMDVSEESLENREGFDSDNWPQKANPDFGGVGHRQADRPAVEADVPR